MRNEFALIDAIVEAWRPRHRRLGRRGSGDDAAVIKTTPGLFPRTSIRHAATGHFRRRLAADWLSRTDGVVFGSCRNARLTPLLSGFAVD